MLVMTEKKDATSRLRVEWWRYLRRVAEHPWGAACDGFVLVQYLDVASGRVTVAETRWRRGDKSADVRRNPRTSNLAVSVSIDAQMATRVGTAN